MPCRAAAWSCHCLASREAGRQSLFGVCEPRKEGVAEPCGTLQPQTLVQSKAFTPKDSRVSDKSEFRGPFPFPFQPTFSPT